MSKVKRSYGPGEKRPRGVQADGRRRAKVKIGDGADGKSIYKYVSGRTKKELEANKEEVRKAYIAGLQRIQRDVLFGRYVQTWYMAHKKPFITVAVQKTYKSVLEGHILPVLGDKQIRAITPDDLQMLLNSLADRPHACGFAHHYLCQIFAKATAQRVVDFNPTQDLQKPELPEPNRRPLTDAETKAAKHVMQNHPNGLILALSYCTGMRRGELLALQWKHVDFENMAIHVEQDIDFKDGGKVGKLKTKKAYRFIPMSDDLIRYLKPLKDLPDTYLIRGKRTGTALGESSYRRAWIRLMRAMYECDSTIEHKDMPAYDAREKATRARSKAPVPQMSVLTQYYFRHNFASMQHDARVDEFFTMGWMGHADITTTKRIYTHLTEQKKAFALQQKELNKAFQDHKD